MPPSTGISKKGGGGWWIRNLPGGGKVEWVHFTQFGEQVGGGPLVGRFFQKNRVDGWNGWVFYDFLDCLSDRKMILDKKIEKYPDPSGKTFEKN